jgi:hypothetical protein
MAKNKSPRAWQHWTSKRCGNWGCRDAPIASLSAHRSHLSLQSASIDHTTDIRLQAGDRESQRRIAEEKRRQDRLWRLQEEAVASNKANAAVEMKWSDLKYYNMPQELNEVCSFMPCAMLYIFDSIAVLDNCRSWRSSEAHAPELQRPKTS